MRILMTFDDVQSLKSAKVMPQSYMDYLVEEWNSLYETYGEDEQMDEFSLKEHGYMICIESGDNNFNPIGLQQGIVHTHPEYVETIELKDTEIYRMGMLYENGRMMMFYSIVGSLDEETENWLAEQAMM